MQQKTFTLTLTNSQGYTAQTIGNVVGDRVLMGDLDWNALDASRTKAASLSIDGTIVLEMTGKAWREIEEASLENFILLATLDSEAAKKIVDAAEHGHSVYRTIVTTSDCTLSCTVFTKTDEEDTILRLATEHGEWELNEGNPISKVYRGGGTEDTEELPIAEFLHELLQTARATLQETARVAELQRLRATEEILVKGLQDLAGAASAKEPEQPEFNTFDDAEKHGMQVARFESARLARNLLAQIGYPVQADSIRDNTR